MFVAFSFSFRSMVHPVSFLKRISSKSIQTQRKSLISVVHCLGIVATLNKQWILGMRPIPLPIV